MDPDLDLSNTTVETILKYLSEPIVLKNVLSTKKGLKLLNWTLEELAEKCGDLPLQFRVGQNSKTDKPQWDNNTKTKRMTMKQFLHTVNQPDNSSNWFYFDYQRMHDWFKDKPEIYNAFNWTLFGLNYSGDNTTMWIGSKGAHTNCHQDTYGCNLVAQTHGRKLWVLFSPDCSRSMEPTRIPHEESTIYSRYNFFAPSKKEVDAINKMHGCVKIITLEPNDVLFIPKGWWHYVECLDTSLSINIWIPMHNDGKDRLTETLVNMVSSTLGNGIPIPPTQEVLSRGDCLDYLLKSLKQCRIIKEKDEEPLQKKKKLFWSDTNLIEELKKRYPNTIQSLTDLTTQNMDSFIKKNNVVTDVDLNTQQNEVCEINADNLYILYETVVEAFCHPEVVSIAAELVIKKFIK